MDRDNRIDSIKGFLIVLVILGHLITNKSVNGIDGCIRAYIYTFHMPLFILISGYLSKRKNDYNDFRNSLLNIAIPLVIFQVLNVILLYLFHNHIDLKMLLVPYWTLWYLLSLIFWRFFLQFSPKFLLNNPSLYILIAFMVSILCGLFPHGTLLSIRRTLNFYLFFLLGYYIRQGIIVPKLWHNSLSHLFIWLPFILLILGLYPETCDVLLKGRDAYSVMQIPSKIYMLICTFVSCFSLYNVIKTNKVLSILGKDSVMYYLYHGIIVKFIIQPFIHYFDLPQTMPFLCLYCVATVAVIYVMSKIRLFRVICNPLGRGKITEYTGAKYTVKPK